MRVPLVHQESVRLRLRPHHPLRRRRPDMRLQPRTPVPDPSPIENPHPMEIRPPRPRSTYLEITPRTPLPPRPIRYAGHQPQPSRTTTHHTRHQLTTSTPVVSTSSTDGRADGTTGRDGGRGFDKLNRRGWAVVSTGSTDGMGRGFDMLNRRQGGRGFDRLNRRQGPGFRQACPEPRRRAQPTEPVSGVNCRESGWPPESATAGPCRLGRGR